MWLLPLSDTKRYTLREENIIWRPRYTEGSTQVTVEAEIAVMLLQPQEWQGLPTIAYVRRERVCPANTLISDFWSPVWE